MATIGSLVTTIIADLGRSETSLSDVVLTDIKSAITEYEGQRFFFNEQLLTLTLTATDHYALSSFAASVSTVSDVIEADNFDVIINSSRKYRLEELTYRDFIEVSANSSGNQGYPQFFSIWNRNVYIYPKASSAGYTGELWAHVKFATVSFSTSDVWSNEAADLIRNATLKRLWGRRYRDLDAARAALVLEQDSLKALQRKTSGLAGNTVSGYL